MNKNQKYIEKMNINRFGSEEIYLRQGETPSIKTLSPLCPMKWSSTNQIIVVKIPVQQAELVNNLIWRQKTSMPVVKILSFKYDSCDYGYPKTYTVQVEPIGKSISNLSGIELGESLYLIQQCLQGVQALTYKYSSFDFHGLFFGLNEKGECRTWVSNNLLSYKSLQLPLPNQDIMICHVLKMVQSSCSNICKMQLQQLFKQIVKIPSLNFTQMNVRLCQFARIKAIIIPKHLLLPDRSTPFSQTKSDIIKCYSSSKEKKLTPYKVNFRYQSPLPKNNWPKENENQLCRQSCIQIQKPHLGWNFQNSHNGIPNSDRRFVSTQKQKQHLGVRFPAPHKTHSVQNMLVSSQNLKNKLKISKDSFKDSMCKNSSAKGSYLNVHQFVVSEQKMKTCTSLTFPSQKTIISQSMIKNEFENDRDYQTKNSESTTNFSDRRNNAYSIMIKEPLQRLMRISQNQNSHPIRNSDQVLNNHYNFGGLIPVPQKSMKQSQQIDERAIQMMELRNRSRISSIHKRNEQILKSMVMNQSDLRDNGTIEFDWDIKIVNLFTQDHNNNLKQSVYCGEEKKPQPLQIRLDLLGKFGRQITSGSIIPEPHQF